MRLKLLFIGMILSTCMHAQSLDTLLAAAVRNNQGLQALQYRQEAMKLKAEGMEYLPPPVLSLEFSQIPVNEINIINKSISNSVAVSQMFPIGGKLEAMSSAEKKGAHAVTFAYKAALRKLTAEVSMQYYTAWGLGKKIQVQKGLIVIMEDALQSLRARYSTGGMLADIHMAEGLLASARITLQSIEQEYTGALQSLRTMCMYHDVITIPEVELDENANLLPENPDLFAGTNPELNQMQAMEQMKIAEMEANNRELIPDLMVQGMFMRMPQGMLVTTGQSMAMLTGMNKTEYMYSLMASITLPFAPWSKGGIDKKSEAILSEAKQYRFESMDMERVMRASLHKLLSTYQANKDKAAALQKSTLPLMRQAEEGAASAFAAGSITMPQLYEYLKMRSMEEMNYYMAVTDMYMSAAEIHMIAAGEKEQEIDRKQQ